jgi:hypothetical protein
VEEEEEVVVEGTVVVVVVVPPALAAPRERASRSLKRTRLESEMDRGRCHKTTPDAAR